MRVFTEAESLHSAFPSSSIFLSDLFEPPRFMIHMCKKFLFSETIDTIKLEIRERKF